VFVCVLGPHALESDWVRNEIELACKLGLTLIPVIQPGFTRPGNPSEAVSALLQNQGVPIPGEENTTYLVEALDALAGYVKQALNLRQPGCRASTCRGIAVGAVVGIVIAGAGPQLPRRSPPSSQPQWGINVADGDHIAQSFTLIAEYQGKLEGDLWVFVASPHGRVCPQSEDSCRGTGAFKGDGKWEVRVGLGSQDSAGDTFDIVLAVAKTPDDSLYIASN
jgi:hypothetical protein